jgi:hypothetical protein
MIRPDAQLSAAWLPMNCLVLEEFQERDIERVRFYLEKMQVSGLHAGPPLSVKPLDNGYFAILDGHHRFVAHILAGRAAIPCVIVRE